MSRMKQITGCHHEWTVRRASATSFALILALCVSDGRAIEAVDRRKLSRIQEALTGAMRQKRSTLSPRVDLVVIDAQGDLSQMVIRHIEAVY